MPTSSHYQARKATDGTWFFTTPTGKVDGMLSRVDALTTSANQERQDKATAETGKGPIAKVLKKHFFPDEG